MKKGGAGRVFGGKAQPNLLSGQQINLLCWIFAGLYGSHSDPLGFHDVVVDLCEAILIFVNRAL